MTIERRFDLDGADGPIPAIAWLPDDRGPHPLVLVGHGGVPKDMPRSWVKEKKQLFRDAAAGDTEAGERAQAIEERIRTFPRTDETDPYGAGIRLLADRLQAQVPDWRVVVAYNEFCAPTIEQAIEAVVAEGATHIRVVTTMITPGGSHSEKDIPEALERVRQQVPGVEIEFVWPLDMNRVAEMFAAHVLG